MYAGETVDCAALSRSPLFLRLKLFSCCGVSLHLEKSTCSRIPRRSFVLTAPLISQQTGFREIVWIAQTTYMASPLLDKRTCDPLLSWN